MVQAMLEKRSGIYSRKDTEHAPHNTQHARKMRNRGSFELLSALEPCMPDRLCILIYTTIDTVLVPPQTMSLTRYVTSQRSETDIRD
jgi:hypothetical protein